MMLTKEELQQHIAVAVGQRETNRAWLRNHLTNGTPSNDAQYQATLQNQGIVLGKLGGFYIALGTDTLLIHQMVADPYWVGVTDTQSTLDPNLE